MKRHPFKTDNPFSMIERLGMRRRDNLRGGIKQGENPLKRSDGFLHNRVKRPDTADRLNQHQQCRDEPGNITNLHFPPRHTPAGDGDHPGNSNTAENFENGVDPGLPKRQFEKISRAG